MSKAVFFIFFFILPFTAFNQNINLRTITFLPSTITESSGLQISGPNLFWTHNDSSNEAKIYGFDTLGNLNRTISISNATNTDWEDITKDDTGNLYIGDFGNNDNNRKDLSIYKIPNPDSFINGEVQAEIIFYTYSNQTAFPPPDHQKNFDMEAMVFFNDSLYLFSKNNTNPFTGYTYLYGIPAKAGTFTAALLDSFYIGQDQIASQVTAADISPDKKKLALLTYSGLIVFDNFEGANFFKGNVSRYFFSELTQKEGICFATDCSLYVTDEEVFLTGRKLYYFEICQVTTGLYKPTINPIIQLHTPFPNPSHAFVVIAYNLPPYISAGEINVIDSYGKVLLCIPISPEEQSIQIATYMLPAGIYSCILKTSRGESHRRKFMVIK